MAATQESSFSLTQKKRIFVLIDAVNNEPKAYGSINGRPYSFERGSVQTVPANLAEHMIICGQAIET